MNHPEAASWLDIVTLCSSSLLSVSLLISLTYNESKEIFECDMRIEFKMDSLLITEVIWEIMKSDQNRHREIDEREMN